MSTDLDFTSRRAISGFHRQRADYYQDLASLLRTAKRKLLDVFELDAERYAGSPRGTLSKLWLERFDSNGADLGATWEGTLPDAELAVLRVTLEGDSDALPRALESIAAMARLSDQVIAETRGTLAMSLLGLMIGVLAVTVLPIFTVGQIQSTFDVPESFWPSAGVQMLHWANWVRSNVVGVSIALVASLAWVSWSIQNWTGDLRNTLDQRILPYSICRDISAVQFLTTMAALTRKRGNVMSTLQGALEKLSASTQNSWLRWRIDQVVDEVHATGAVSATCFDTGLLPQEIYWRLRDLEESKGLSESFEETALFVEQTILPRLAKTLARIRAVILLVGLALTVAMVVWTGSVMSGMTKSAMNFYGSQ